MGLFDAAIATCKAYLKPVKQATRELLLLQEQAKVAKEHDEINEEAQLDNLLQGSFANNDPELLRSQRKNLKEKLINNSMQRNISFINQPSSVLNSATREPKEAYSA